MIDGALWQPAKCLAGSPATCARTTTWPTLYRMSALRDAQRIMVLEQSEVAEDGTCAELVKRPQGLYARLHALQAE